MSGKTGRVSIRTTGTDRIEQILAMFSLSNLCINKTVVAQKSDPSPEQTNVAPQPSLHTTKTITPSSNMRRHRPPRPSVIQIERVVGAGSFRDAEPRGLEPKKSTVLDLFLGKAVEGAVEKKLRITGEWLVNNAEKRVRSSGKGILMFMFQWMLPIWAISLLVACGVIKLPFSSPFLDDLIM